MYPQAFQARTRRHDLVDRVVLTRSRDVFTSADLFAPALNSRRTDHPERPGSLRATRIDAWFYSQVAGGFTPQLESLPVVVGGGGLASADAT